MNKLLYILFIAQGILFQSTSNANAEVTIGIWCDKPIPNNAEYNNVLLIIVTDLGGVEMRTTLPDREIFVQNLEELGNEIYSVVDSSHGDKFRIVPGSGYLQLIDNEGLIRTALPLFASNDHCLTD